MTRWWISGRFGLGLLGAGCSPPAADAAPGSTSSSVPLTTTDPTEAGGGATTEAPHAAWFALGQGEFDYRPLVDGDELAMVLGSQGAWMFPIGVRGGGFTLPADPADLHGPDVPRFDLWLDIDGYEVSVGGHLAEVDDLPLLFTVAGDGTYVAPYVPLILPEVLADLRDLDGAPARLHGELSTRDGLLAVELAVTVRAPPREDGGGSGDEGGDPPEDGDSSGDESSDGGGEPPEPQFVDVTAELGLEYVQGPKNLAPDCKLGYSNNPTGDHCQPERMLGGVAVGDVDDDGDLDLYVTRLDATDHLFVQEDGLFVDRAPERGLTMKAPSSGAVWVDVENDGDLDLYVTSVGDTRYYLFINDDGQFSEQGQARGAAVETMFAHVGMTPTLGDYDGDGYLDLYTGEWRLMTQLIDGPDHARLLHNRGALDPGSFEDLTDPAGVSMYLVGNMIGPLVFSPAFVDLDEDDLPDFPVVSDFDSSRLFWNDGDGSFSDGTAAAGVGSDHNGMGSTFADFDGDGRLDWFVSSIYNPKDPDGDDGNRLYRNLGDRSFVDATEAAGVRDGGWGWGAAAFDHDNDGDIDLAQTGGWGAPAYQEQRLRFWRQDGGWPLTEVAQQIGLDDVGQGRGVVVLDYDDDGDLDLFLTHNAGPGRMFRNDGGNARPWLRVQARGTTSNTQGIGARVRVRVTPGATPQVREIGASTHFMGQSEAVAHFGLGSGEAPIFEVRVEWPASGAVQVFHDVPRRSLLTAVEP